jgi:hypothetical protein
MPRKRWLDWSDSSNRRRWNSKSRLHGWQNMVTFTTLSRRGIDRNTSRWCLWHRRCWRSRTMRRSGTRGKSWCVRVDVWLYFQHLKKWCVFIFLRFNRLCVFETWGNLRYVTLTI